MGTWLAVLFLTACIVQAQLRPAPPTPLAPVAPQAPFAPLAPDAFDGGMGAAEPPLHSTELPMLDCAGLPCIDMTTGSGATLRLLIDTGRINSYLNSKAAQSLGVELRSLEGGDAVSAVRQTVVPGAKLGDLPMGDFPFMVLDTTPQPERPKLKEPAFKQQPLPADGALTFSAFRNRLLQLDYSRRVVRISEPQGTAQPCPEACSNLVIKRFGRFGSATLTTGGFAVNGQPLDVQIDTLFTGTMLVYPTSVEKLGLRRVVKTKHKETFPFTQGGMELARAESAAEDYLGRPLMENAPLYFFTPDQPAPSVQFDATVGSGLLSRAVVTFDFKAMHMWME